VKDLKEQADVPGGKVTAALGRLEEAGVLELRPGGEVVATDDDKLDLDAVAGEAVREQEMYREYRQARVELMKDYAETRDCRRRYILNYFGETIDGPCGHCDNCEAGVVEKHEAETGNLPFAIKSRVTHKKYGEGTVMRYEEDKVVVLFEEEGMKSFVTQFVIDNGLLKPGGN
jgi:ATP-dependent DNA helicase RecQ